MIFKTRYFARWARKVGLTDSQLAKAVSEVHSGLLDADLGGGVLKKRVAPAGKGKRGGVRTLLATNRDDRWFFVFGFEKNERENISDIELSTLKKLTKDLLGLSAMEIVTAVREGSLVEVKNEKETT